MEMAGSVLVFAVDKITCAISLHEIERVVRAALIEPVSYGPEFLQGVVNIHGDIFPVINTRRLFHFSEKPCSSDDFFLMTRCPAAGGSSPVFIVDHIWGIQDVTEQDIRKSDTCISEIKYLEGVCLLKEKILYLYNLTLFCSSAGMLQIAMVVQSLRNSGRL